MKLIGLLLVGMVMTAASAPERWRGERVAVRKIKRLPPSAFPQLPGTVLAYLQRRGCRIPQSAYRDGRHNVARGAFMVRGRLDWAILCSIRGSSTILLFKVAGTRPVAELATVEDRDFIQGGVGGVPEFSRSISRASRRQILSYRQAFGGSLPSRLDHDGIDDSFDGKASVIRYFEKGRWHELQGMD